MTSITARTATILAGLNGAWQDTRVVWASEPKPRAAHKGVHLRKVTSAIVRAGVEYAKLPEVQEAIAAGERGEVQELRWGRYVVPGYVIEHRGAEYIRLAPSVGRMSTTYEVDGAPVDAETFKSYLTPSAAAKMGEAPIVFTVKAENILAVGGVSLAA